MAGKPCVRISDTDSCMSNVIEFHPKVVKIDPEPSIKAARDLVAAITTQGFSTRIFCETIRSEHPHTQVNVGEVVFQLITHWAHAFKNLNFDPRDRELVEKSATAIYSISGLEDDAFHNEDEYLDPKDD